MDVPSLSPADRSARRSDLLLHALGKFQQAWPRRLALAAAIVLVAPTLFAGFALDDYVLLYQMARHGDGEWAGSLPFDLFRWMDAKHDSRLIDGAGLPWWTFDQARCAFMRPFSSLTHAVDHWLWPSSAFGMHLHSLVWFAILLWVARKAYSALIESPWVAGVASAMFALDSAHGEAVGWISNRNALISGAFGIAALWLHHLGRTAATTRLRLAAAACFGLSLMSGELGVGVVGYLLAYALLFDRGPRNARIASLWPYGALFVIWAALRRLGGYGTSGLGVYVDPIKEPFAFIVGVPSRALLLFSSQVSRICADLYDTVPASLQLLLLACAFVVTGLLAWLAWPSLRAQRSTRFFAAGAALSLVPVTATLPSDRLLALIGFGVMPVIAQAAHDAFEAVRSAVGRARTRQQTLRSAFAWLLVFVHFVLDPLLLPLLALSPALIAKSEQIAEEGLPADAELLKRDVIVVEVPDSAILSYVPVIRSFDGKPRPNKLYWLTATADPTRVERRATNVLRVSSPSGFFDRRWESRSSQLPFHEGDRIALSEMTVHVVKLTKDARPAVCDFEFAAPLEATRYLWETWHDGHLVAWALPKIGQSTLLSAN